MAQPYVTGPAHMYVQSGGSPVYLGTAERTPRIEVRPGQIPVMNDIGGPVVPFDMMYSGEEAFISADLTRWNNSVLQTILGRPIVGSPPGADSFGSIGTIISYEGMGFVFYIVFPYSSKPAYSTQEAGYRFFSCYVIGPDDHYSLGTNPRKIHLAIHALRVYDPASQSLSLFDFNVADAQAIPVN